MERLLQVEGIDPLLTSEDGQTAAELAQLYGPSRAKSTSRALRRALF